MERFPALLWLRPRRRQGPEAAERIQDGHRVCARVPDQPGQNPANPKTTPGEAGAQ